MRAQHHGVTVDTGGCGSSSLLVFITWSFMPLCFAESDLITWLLRLSTFNGAVVAAVTAAAVASVPSTAAATAAAAAAISAAAAVVD